MSRDYVLRFVPFRLVVKGVRVRKGYESWVQTYLSGT